MRVLLTGAYGFLGWHTRMRLQALTGHEVVPVGRANWTNIDSLVGSTDAVIHVAGVNRGHPDHVYGANVDLARDLANALLKAPIAPRLIYTSSIQAQNDSPYGRGKREAAHILAEATATLASPYTEVRLPNIFGEHARPDYNSFVATFVDRTIRGVTPTVQDGHIELLHAQDAAKLIIGALTDPSPRTLTPAGTPTTVLEVWRTINALFDTYRHGEIPPLTNRLEVNLLNTLRAAAFDEQPLALTRRADTRGTLVETVRAHGSEGQTFISTTAPGITRGQHFHLRKLERFAVVAGSAEISLRQLYTNDIRHFSVNGDGPVAIDMPTGWAHKITNTGSNTLVTMFWTNELFDPQDSDTYPEEV